MPNTLREWLALLGFAALSLAPCAAGMLFARPALESGWYENQLTKPAWIPPPGVLTVLWAAFVLTLGCAAWRVWRAKGFVLRATWLVFAAHLGLAAAWAWFFFGLRNPGAAFFELLLLWLSAATVTYLFDKAKRGTGWWLLPYLVFLTFAAALNFRIWRINAEIETLYQGAPEVFREGNESGAR